VDPTRETVAEFLERWLRDRGKQRCPKNTHVPIWTGTRKLLADVLDEKVGSHAICALRRTAMTGAPEVFISYAWADATKVNKIDPGLLVYLVLDDTPLPKYDPTRIAVTATQKPVKDIGEALLLAITGKIAEPIGIIFYENEPAPDERHSWPALSSTAAATPTWSPAPGCIRKESAVGTECAKSCLHNGRRRHRTSDGNIANRGFAVAPDGGRVWRVRLQSIQWRQFTGSAGGKGPHEYHADYVRGRCRRRRYCRPHWRPRRPASSSTSGTVAAASLYAVAEAAIQQGLTPDTIVSDVHAVSINTPGMPYLPWVVSKFLNLGFSLEQVIAMATINPAKVIGRVDGLGTLNVGAPADVSILELIEESVKFVDTLNNQRRGTRWLRPVETVRAGRPFGRPHPSPVSYPA
jgi:amidohydrolase family protein